MTEASVTVSSDVIDDGHYEVTVAQTGPDTASVDVEKWAIGSDYTSGALSEDAHDLTDIRLMHNGYTLTAQTKVAMWFHATVTLVLSQPGQTPSLTVNGKTYPVTAANYANIQTFITTAAFPLA